MNYIKDIERDEIRDGFLVTTDRKKQWNHMLELLVLFDKICKKHGIRYYLAYGTLIGAARHRGFIPWDDDMDVLVPRPDYQRLMEIMPQELEYPLYYTSMYNFPWFKTFCKVMDLSTTAGVINEYNEIGAGGIWIDIFPLDFDRNPNITYSEDMELIFKTAEELIALMLRPDYLFKEIKEGKYQPVFPLQILEKLYNSPREVPFKLMEDFLLKHYDDSDYCSYFVFEYRYTRFCGNIPLPKTYYGNGTGGEFEGLTFPCPDEIDKCLTTWYGDWRKPVRFGSLHEGHHFSVDIPHDYFMQNAKYF